MDKLKIDNYSKAFPGTEFPHYESLSATSIAWIRARLLRRFHLATNANPLAIVRDLDALGVVCEGIDANNETFHISDVLISAQVPLREHVYINWYRYDDLDKLRLHDLDKSFTDIWYPGVDDIDVFDDSMDWILSIAHSGIVKLIQAPPRG